MTTIPNTDVKFSDIQTALGGTNPISMSEYFADATTGFSAGVAGIPNRFSEIKMSVFRGKNKSGELYAFNSHTFTNAGVSGRTGPTLSQCRTAYNSTTWASTYLNMTTQGIQQWTVPKTGSYNFTLAGARGGNVWTINGGLGRTISQTGVPLTAGTVLHLVVGQHGGNSVNNAFGDSLAAGGGGGSFVYVNSVATGNCILAAGGGGGAAWNSGVASRDGQTSTSGSSGGAGTVGTFSGGAGGTNGNGGTAGGGNAPGANGTNIEGGFGGIDNGTGGAGGGGGMGVGGVGATFLGGTAPGNTLGSSSKPGGFGGGGGCSIAEYGGRGGGGGYSGGGGGGAYGQGVGGGGGSYSAYSTGYNNNAGTNSGHGYITITFASGALYSFSSHTFTNAGVTGRAGPTLSQCRSAYSSVSWTQDATNNWLNMTTQGIQLWKVPVTGTYTIQCLGASGGPAGTNNGGRGTSVSGTFSLTQNEVLAILVGQEGGNNATCNAGGGGGTFVWNTASTTEPLIVAGGGGGANSSVSGLDAQTSTGGSGTNGTPGTNGNGATPGGSGWKSNGGSGYNGNNTGCQRPLDGGSGGAAISGTTVGDGGFGGGASASGEPCSNGGPGGGGGYSGGAGPSTTTATAAGGGGGSYNTGTSQSSSVRTVAGHGAVTITRGVALPTYYTSTSGFMLYYAYNQTTASLKLLSDINSSSVVRTYNGINACWNIVHDKDLDSNVFYGMPEDSRTLYKYVLTKGGTSITTTTITTYNGATSSVLGACYAPACMGTSNGAFIIGGFSQSVIHVLEFDNNKNVSNTYTVPYTSEVYGTEVIPSQASGFSQHFAVAYTRGSKQLSSYTVDMTTRTWSNRYDISYTSGTNGPENGLGMIYYPQNKAIFTGDPHTSSNRIAMNDTSGPTLYVWTIIQNGNQLNFTFLKTVTMVSTGGYPYSLSTDSYNAIS